MIARGLGAPGVELNPGGLAAGEGRVEPAFGMAQDRLVKDIWASGVATLAAANRFFGGALVPFWNECFAVPSVNPLDARRRAVPVRRATLPPW